MVGVEGQNMAAQRLEGAARRSQIPLKLFKAVKFEDHGFL
jgi:hypothetical protein